MKKLLITGILFYLLCILFSCKKDNDPSILGKWKWKGRVNIKNADAVDGFNFRPDSCFDQQTLEFFANGTVLARNPKYYDCFPSSSGSGDVDIKYAFDKIKNLLAFQRLGSATRYDTATILKFDNKTLLFKMLFSGPQPNGDVGYVRLYER